MEYVEFCNNQCTGMQMTIRFILQMRQLRTQQKSCRKMARLRVHERYKANYLEGNLSKYQVMRMTKGKSDFTKVDNQVLVQMKLLGLTLDKELNFSDHVSYICKNTSKRIRFYTRPRKLIRTTINAPQCPGRL